MVKKYFFNTNMEHPEVLQTDSYDIAYYVRRNPGGSITEDSLGIATDGRRIFVGVADGMGGHPCGEEASQAAVETVIDGMVGDSKDSPNPIQHFEDANSRILGAKKGSGTTLLVLELTGRKLRFYNVGDCLGLVLGGRGKIKLETRQHNTFGYGVQSGLLEDSSENSLRYGGELENFLGTENMHLDVSAVRRLAPRDTVLLMSDGIYDHIDFTKISLNGGALDMCQAIVAEAKKTMESDEGREDDSTIVVICFAPG